MHVERSNSLIKDRKESPLLPKLHLLCLSQEIGLKSSSELLQILRVALSNLEKDLPVDPLPDQDETSTVLLGKKQKSMWLCAYIINKQPI